jgi:hypothetical protein
MSINMTDKPVWMTLPTELMRQPHEDENGDRTFLFPEHRRAVLDLIINRLNTFYGRTDVRIQVHYTDAIQEIEFTCCLPDSEENRTLCRQEVSQINQELLQTRIQQG